METITCDIETFYDRDFSLSKMQTDAYILDPRFEVILVTVITPDGKEHWFSGDELETAGWLRQFPWESCAARFHNTLFDGFILTQRFGIRPKLWKDTLGQLRMLRPYLPSHSLANMAKHFGLEDKGTEVQAAIGKRRADFNPVELAAYAAYGMKDTRICKAAGEIMDDFTPPLALKLIDMTIRMFTEPMLVGDRASMQALYEDEVVRKQRLLEAAEVDREVIMSNNKFAERLESLGVIPPKKISKTTGKETFAFSKTDKEFTDLQEHELPEVQALVAARLGTKTTIAETRALRFVEMASRGPLPVYLGFWGAKTTGRYSGGNFCLVGDTRITVLRDECILDIQLSELDDLDLVWDGVEFVAHDGLLDQGVRDVITYDGVEGTPDHVVYTEERGPRQLSEALASGDRIEIARRPTQHDIDLAIARVRDQNDKDEAQMSLRLWFRDKS